MAAIIFDFDGVIADSESLANTVLAEHVSLLGRTTTTDEALGRYMGRRWAEAMALIAEDVGRALPASFSDDLQAATLERFEVELREVTRATAFIKQFADVPHAIASSSSASRLALCLKILGLENEFKNRVFSADLVLHGKPSPDIFLLAAKKLETAPADCLVIEDSRSGVVAAIAAGMSVIGLSAASHVRKGHAAALGQAGALHLATSWMEVAEITSAFLAARG